DGDAEIVARVDSLQNTAAWAKAGVMIREDLTGNAANVLAPVTAANGISFQQRGTRGNMTTFTPVAPAAAAPHWVRLVRSGNTLSGYYSATGITWTLITTATMTLPTRVYVGLAVTSHNASVSSTATFSNVTVSQRNRPRTVTQPANQALMPPDLASQASAEKTAVSAPPVTRATFNDYDGD